MTEPPPLGDGRLGLEPLTVQHADEMVDVLSDAALYRFTGGSPPTLDELRSRYARQFAGSGNAVEEWHTWVVRLGADGPAVGFVQATVRWDDGVAELAWVVGTPWQGRGIARDAAVVVLDHVTTGVARVIAHIHPEHVASQRVATALGMVPTDRLVDGEVEWALDLAPPEVGGGAESGPERPSCITSGQGR